MTNWVNAARPGMRVDYQIGIVGAGFGGIIAALDLKRSGMASFVIFERAPEPGGVWRDNVYPGCACDIRSHLYSIESDPNPDWSSSYASQPEIFQYLKDVVRRHDLQRHIRYSATVTEVRFLEEDGCWLITDQNGGTCRVRTVIIATGPQSRPWYPRFKGQETFRGKTFHSSAWDASVVLDGKRVAVVGTGASAIQIVPNIAPVVSQLVVFQRTPAWILSRWDKKIGSFRRWLYRHVPAAQTFVRGLIYWFLEFIGLAFLGNATIEKWLTTVALHKLNKEVHDPAVRAKLTPHYQIGCKRVLVADDFYPAFNRANVRLVTESIEEIAPTGIRTEDGRLHEVDTIVFATGFVVADTDNYLRIIGREGRILAEDWNRNGGEAYLGINVAGYPNMALLLGPNSGLGHSSALHVMESQMKYVLQYVGEIARAGGNAYLDVKPELQTLYNIELQKRLTGTVWASGCRSWYLNRNGRNTTLYPGLMADYRRVISQFRAADYDLVRHPSEALAETATVTPEPT